MIECIHLGKRYRSSGDALLDINLTVEASELLFLTGHSGAGKSTLLKMIAMIEQPSRGKLLVNGHNIAELPRHAIPEYRRNLGIIFQDHQLLNDRSVFDNVALPLIINAVPHTQVKKRVQAALDKVGLLEKAKLNPKSLSTGQQQRVGIARAIVDRPAIVLADEPTGNLDPTLSAEIMQLFIDFNQVGVTVIIASHDQHLINSFGKRIVELETGQLKQDAP